MGGAASDQQESQQENQQPNPCLGSNAPSRRNRQKIASMQSKNTPNAIAKSTETIEKISPTPIDLSRAEIQCVLSSIVPG